MCRILVLVCTALAAAGDDRGTPARDDAGGTAHAIFDSSPADRLPAWLRIGGQIRGRFEAPSGTTMINNISGEEYLSRIRLDVSIRPARWLRLFVQAQDARVAGYPVSPASGTVFNPIDLRQGYVELGGEGTRGVMLRLGRQELLFGGERLIGPADWGMSRTFDAVDLSVARGKARVDFFAGSAVAIDPDRWDRHKAGEHVYGAYGSIKSLGPRLNVEPYLLFKRTLLIKSENGRLGDGLVTSPGVRVLGALPAHFDYIAELVVQRGSYSADSVAAAGQSYVVGWTVPGFRCKPRFSAEYNYASGDGTLKDGHRNTFDQFYPSNHSYYGMFDQFGWKNMKNFRAGFDCVPAKKLKFRADYNEFYLATVQDAFYNSASAAVVLNRNATSGHIGNSLGGIAVYQWTKIWKFGAGYTHLWAGTYLKQAKTGFGYTYPYLMFAGSF